MKNLKILHYHMGSQIKTQKSIIDGVKHAFGLYAQLQKTHSSLDTLDIGGGFGIPYEKKKFYTLHLCRHTCASRLVQRGVPLLLVKDWLGHEDIQTTMIYAHLAPKALHSVVGLLND